MTNVSLKILKQTRALSVVRVSWAGCTILCGNRSIKETESLVQFTKILTNLLHLFPALWVAGDISPRYYRLKNPKVLSGTVLFFFSLWVYSNNRMYSIQHLTENQPFHDSHSKKCNEWWLCLSKPWYIHQSWFGILILLCSCKKSFRR